MLKGCADKVKIFLESARALAPSQIAAEQAWQASRKHNVEIVCSDIPDLFTHSPTPAQSFIRKVHCAAQEFNKDMVVYHLSQGLANKVKTTKEITQKGSPKVNGCKSVIQKLKPSQASIKQVKKLKAQRDKGEFGWRPLATKVSKVLRVKACLAPETVRRLCVEIKVKKL
ncbi:unnamed protein product [Effrenium voratum]|nr:unnamed protein product [Effrenium voratum]